MDAISLYCLHRITSIKLTDETFKPPKNFKYTNEDYDSFGVFINKDIKKCKIRFFNESVVYVSERKFSNDQLIEKREDGSIIITFSSGQIYEVLRFVLSQGCNAIPLEPDELAHHASRLFWMKSLCSSDSGCKDSVL